MRMELSQPKRVVFCSILPAPQSKSYSKLGTGVYPNPMVRNEKALYRRLTGVKPAERPPQHVGSIFGAQNTTSKPYAVCVYEEMMNMLECATTHLLHAKVKQPHTARVMLLVLLQIDGEAMGSLRAGFRSLQGAVALDDCRIGPEDSMKQLPLWGSWWYGVLMGFGGVPAWCGFGFRVVRMRQGSGWGYHLCAGPFPCKNPPVSRSGPNSPTRPLRR